MNLTIQESLRVKLQLLRIKMCSILLRWVSMLKRHHCSAPGSHWMENPWQIQDPPERLYHTVVRVFLVVGEGGTSGGPYR